MKILISAQDPGGAQAIIPVIKELIIQGHEAIAIIDGPACVLFDQHAIPYEKGSVYTNEELKARINEIDPGAFLAGTSGSYDSIDKRIIKELGTTVQRLYVMDFWNNYRLRFQFSKDDPFLFETMIAVIDEKMRDEMIKEGFPADSIKVTGSPYLEYCTEHIPPERENPAKLLYISQPVSELAGFEDYNELLVLKRLAHLITKLPENYTLLVRPHPRESTAKFSSYMSERIQLSQSTSLEEDLAGSHTVIGLFSPVLLQAALLRKNVISYQWGPHKGSFFPLELADLLSIVSDDETLRACILEEGKPQHTLPSFKGSTRLVTDLLSVGKDY